MRGASCCYGYLHPWQKCDRIVQGRNDRVSGLQHQKESSPQSGVLGWPPMRVRLAPPQMVTRRGQRESITHIYSTFVVIDEGRLPRPPANGKYYLNKQKYFCIPPSGYLCLTFVVLIAKPAFAIVFAVTLRFFLFHHAIKRLYCRSQKFSLRLARLPQGVSPSSAGTGIFHLGPRVFNTRHLCIIFLVH